jgi:hypothetical protein
LRAGDTPLSAANELATRLPIQAVIAIENVRLFDEVQARDYPGRWAADGDLGGAQCHQLFARRVDACVSDDA